MRSAILRCVLSFLALAIAAPPARAEEAPKPPAAPMAEPAADLAPSPVTIAPAPQPAEPPAPAAAPAVEPAPPVSATPAPAPAMAEPATPEPSPAPAPAMAEPATPEPSPAPAPALPAEVQPGWPLPPPVAAPTPVPAPEPVEEIEDVTPVAANDLAWDLEAIVQQERVLNVPLAQTTRKHSFLLIVDHRAFQAAFNKNTWHDFFGLDGGGLRVGLGLRFGILDGLDVGIYRLSNATDAFDTYELDAKWRFLRADRHYIDMAIRAGVTWFSQQHAADAVGGFGQLLISRQLFKRLTLGTGLLFHSDSSSDVKSNKDTAWSMAVPGAVEVRILPWLAWNVEASFKVAGYGAKWPSFSSAVKFLTSRHVFSLILTNTQYIGADGIVANSRRGYRDLIVGFQIQREFPL